MLKSKITIFFDYAILKLYKGHIWLDYVINKINRSSIS